MIRRRCAKGGRKSNESREFKKGKNQFESLQGLEKTHDQFSLSCNQSAIARDVI